MGGSSGGKVLNAIKGPQTAGGPTPTLTQAQAYYPMYSTYYGQPVQQNSSNIGLTIPTDMASLRQAAAANPAPMLVNRAAYNPNNYIAMRSAPPVYRSNPVATGFYNPARSYGPQPSYANAMPSTDASALGSAQSAPEYAAPRPVPVPTYTPQVTLNPVNPDPNANKPAVNVDQQRIDAERAYQEALANGLGGGASWSNK